jgi:hypothetical protein
MPDLFRQYDPASGGGLAPGGAPCGFGAFPGDGGDGGFAEGGDAHAGGEPAADGWGLALSGDESDGAASG